MSARGVSFVCVIAFAAAIAGCGGKPAAPPGENAAPAMQPAARESTTSSGTPASGDLASMIANADLAKGKILFLQCRACHSLVPEAEPGKIGPTLYRVIGRAAGAVPGFDYSEAVAKSGITWSAAQIDRWLARPSDFLPGNKMVFIGIEKPQDRANIIAFIQEESAKPLQ